MSVKTMPITEARAKLPKLVKAADERLDRTVITTKGRPSAVIMSYQEYEAWEETLDILCNPESLEAIRNANEELAGGKTSSFEQVFGHKQPKIRQE